MISSDMDKKLMKEFKKSHPPFQFALYFSNFNYFLTDCSFKVRLTNYKLYKSKQDKEGRIVSHILLMQFLHSI
jgi:hypothetical protein